jgi:hypothetical protein
MATERRDAVERRGQFCTDDDRLAERFGAFSICSGRSEVDRGCRDASPVVSGRVPAIAHKLGPASGRAQATGKLVLGGGDLRSVTQSTP